MKIYLESSLKNIPSKELHRLITKAIHFRKHWLLETLTKDYTIKSSYILEEHDENMYLMSELIRPIEETSENVVCSFKKDIEVFEENGDYFVRAKGRELLREFRL